MAGTVIARTPHFVLHCAALDAPDPRMNQAIVSRDSRPLFPVSAPWLGAMVPKRWAKRAVTRNAIKRQIYSVSGESQARFSVAAHVVRLRMTFDRGLFPSASSGPLKAAVRQELQQLFGNLPAPEGKAAVWLKEQR